MEKAQTQIEKASNPSLSKTTSPHQPPEEQKSEDPSTQQLTNQVPPQNGEGDEHFLVKEQKKFEKPAGRVSGKHAI